MLDRFSLSSPLSPLLASAGWALVALLALVPNAGAAGAPAPAAQPLGTSVEAPRLVLDEPVRDFGEVFEGAVLQHRFPMTVAGSEDLVLHKIKPSCGCTVARLWRLGAPGSAASEPELVEEGETLAPGTRLELETHFETQGKLGPQKKRVTLFTSGTPARSDARIDALVVSALRASPQALKLGRFSVRQSGAATAEVSTVDGEPIGLFVGELEANVPETLTVELEALEPDAEGRSPRWNVTARLGMHSPEGILRHRLYLRTDRIHPDAPRTESGAPGVHQFSIWFEAQVLGILVARPKSLAFGLIHGDRAAERTTRINCYDPEVQLEQPQVTLLNMEGDGPFQFESVATVTASAVPDVPGAFDIQLQMGVLPSDFDGSFRGRIALEFGSDLPPLQIPFTGFHKPANAPRPLPPARSDR